MRALRISPFHSLKGLLGLIPKIPQLFSYQVERDNRILLEKMAHIMRTRGRVDNINSYQYKSLNKEKRQRELVRVTQVVYWGMRKQMPDLTSIQLYIDISIDKKKWTKKTVSEIMSTDTVRQGGRIRGTLGTLYLGLIDWRIQFFDKKKRKFQMSLSL